MTPRAADHQLVVADAVLRGREGRWHLGIDDGRIRAVSAHTLSGAEEIDAAGRLVTESFANGHMHLDKVHTLDRIGDAALTAYTSGVMGSALHSINLASAVKADYDRAWIEPNARRAVVEAVRHGVRHVLAFADVDTSAGLEGVIPLIALREEFRGIVDLQVVAFPQDGLLCDPGAAELVARGRRPRGRRRGRHPLDRAHRCRRARARPPDVRPRRHARPAGGDARRRRG